MYQSWEDVGPQEGKQELAMSLVGKVDFMLWGGSRFGGKSQLLTLAPLLFCSDPKYRGIFFRNTFGEITGAGSLWDKAESVYPLFDAYPRQNPLSWNFPKGAKQYYSYMDQENDKEGHRGKGYSLIGFDEIDKFSPTQITFMFTCLRSEADVDSTMIGTLNPDPDSWCLPLVDYYLDDEGFPDPDRCGDIRYFIIDNNNDFIFGDSEEYFLENYRDYLYVYNPVTDEEDYIPPKTFTYIFFNIYDNPVGMKSEPKYLMQLNNLPEHEKKTQLYGNWYARPKSSSMWSRDWIRGENGERVLTRDQVPDRCVAVRGLDKAHTEPHPKNMYPDYTALSPLIKKDENGFYYLIGDYLDSFVDPVRKKGEKPVIGRFRLGPGARDELVIKQMKEDNRHETVTLILPKDAGGGKSDGLYTKAKLVENKLKFEDGVTPANTPDKKIKDFGPFASACQQGLVFIVEESFHPSTLRWIYQEIENFNGERSTSSRKDDVVDAITIGFNYAITARRPYSTPSFGRNTEASKTLSHHLIKDNMLKDYYESRDKINRPR